MTSDGTNSYKWDAANRLIEIDYPGSNNKTEFIFDSASRCVTLVEITGGTVTDTKQFVWGKLSRLEERDASGNVTKKFLKHGQVNASTSYFYICDHLGSVRQLSDSAGTIVRSYDYSPFGEEIGRQTGVDADFRYASLYFHNRSKLGLTAFRAYNASLACWISRDPSEIGSNLYGYGANNPMKYIDPLGLFIEVGDDPKNKGGTLVRIPITFKGGPWNPTLLDTYIAGINKYWNPGNLMLGDCKIRFEAFQGSINGNTNRITIVGNWQSNGTLRDSGVWSVPTNGWYDRANLGWAAAHEIGHTMGLIHEDGGKIMIEPDNRNTFSGGYAQQSDVDTIFRRGAY
jgi:RHS repeat-associated protein